MPEPSAGADPAAVSIRTYDPERPGDRAAIERICVLTGHAGADATGLHSDVRELTERYATPYLDLAPEWAWVAELDGAVVGYLLGAPDTAAFARAYAARPSSLTEVERAEHAEAMLVPELAELPAHLHVDILPAAQGRGVGRMLVQTLIDRLRAAGVPGVHLVVDPRNAGALAFYPRLGFTELRRTPDGVVFGRRLG